MFSCNQLHFLYNYAIDQCEIFFPNCALCEDLKYTDKLWAVCVLTMVCY